MNALLEVRESPIHGRGVFARRRVPAHSLLGVYAGQVTTENDTYVLWVEYDDGEVVGIDGDNELRYLNHSRTPNAVFRGAELFALCAIEAGAEVTFDYGEEWAVVD